jgi:hypothetical protein
MSCIPGERGWATSPEADDLVQAPPLLSKISDLELLSIICQLGRAATESSIRHSINERIGRKVSVEWVKHRITEIEAAGLAAASPPGQAAPSVRLTAVGVERLSGTIRAR